MAVYLLHISPPYQHASHYLGYTSRVVEERVADHFAGRGSPLIQAALAAGCEVTVAQRWVCGTRGFERALKNRKDATRWCPVCTGRRNRRITFAAFLRRERERWGHLHHEDEQPPF